MQLELNDISIDHRVTENVQLAPEDYSVVLEHYSLEYKQVGYYLQVGEITKVQGWILHISVVRSQIIALLKMIIPELIFRKVSFKIPKDKETARCLLDGNIGHSLVGKVISIYPESDAEALDLAKIISVLTTNFKGPSILTDIYLGGGVYTRYGSFKPIFASDAAGKLNQFIYDVDGLLVKDQYNIPFKMPMGIEWPFATMASPIVAPQKKILNQIYKPISILKSDAKGNVIKALYLKSLFHINWCVIKQGKRNMWSDDIGRDIPDRLLWQQELHKELVDKIPLPKILDLFNENGDTYLVMEYIKGKSLHDQLANLNNNCACWFQISLANRIMIVEYLLQIISIIDRLHQNGFVHRDITPANFLVNKKNSLSLIDNELAYSLNSKKPNPPFAFGTSGFMSPEQMEIRTPTIKEDIYGLGASMILIFSGLSPLIFNTQDHDALRDNLYFFIRNNALVGTIVACLDPDPRIRPQLSYIENTIHHYKVHLQEKNYPKKPIHQNKINSSEIETIVKGAIAGLASEPTLIIEDLWQSRTPSKDNIPGIQRTEFGKSGGLYEGITGILYFLARAKKLGFNIETCQKAYYKGWDFINNNYLKMLPNIPPGLYGGAAGIALAMSSGINAGMLQNREENRLMIQQCLDLQPAGLDLATGVAGQGIAALQCGTHFEKEKFEKLLQEYISVLMDAQQTRGHWIQLEHRSGKHSNAASFSFGNSGITWLLLEYAARYNDIDVQNAAIRSLKSWTGIINRIKKFVEKNGSRKIVVEHVETHDSLQGIILTLIKAYETLREPTYKKLAEELLSTCSAYLVNDNFSQDTGLAGFGELYLEAARIFGNCEWQLRADWIAAVFTNTCRKENDSYHWLGNNCDFPIADFMVGNSGIIHFLMRYLRPDELGYRLLV